MAGLMARLTAGLPAGLAAGFVAGAPWTRANSTAPEIRGPRS